MRTIVRITAWAIVALGAVALIGGVLTSCSDSNVVGTVPYTDQNADAITWDDDLAQALCSLDERYCPLRIVPHTAGEAVAASAVKVGTLGQDGLVLAPMKPGTSWDCGPVEEVHCWLFWDIYNYEWTLRCDFGDCTPESSLD